MTGTVSGKNRFVKKMDQTEYLIMQALRTYYHGSDMCKIQIVVGGVETVPFILTKRTAYLVFTNPFIFRPDTVFELRVLEGSGTLEFTCIGAAIYERAGFGGLAYTVMNNAKRSEMEELKEEDSRLSAFVRSWEHK